MNFRITFRILIILISVFFCARLFSQTGEFSVSQVNDGSIIDVSIFVKRTSSEPWNLGFASLVFNFNSASMTNPAELSEGLFDNNVNTDYDDQFISLYQEGNAVSLELGITSVLLNGTEVPDYPVLIGTVRFEITNPQSNHNIQWNTLYTAVHDKDGNNITGGMNFINPQNELLPVELINFSAQTSGNNVTLSWSTSNEINNSGFEIQRANVNLKNENGLIWGRAGFIKGKGTHSGIVNYNFEDKEVPAGKYGYRLKQTDYNGNYEYFLMNGFIDVSYPGKYSLKQNFPNPFNPETVIKFDIPKTSVVSIKIFDITGKEMSELANGVYTPGSYAVRWNASSYSSGVYFCILKSDNILLAKKLSLIK